MALLGPTHGTEIWDKNDKSTGDTVLKKLFREIGPRYADRPGGYTRVLKQHYRRLGDAGATAVIELLKAGEKKVHDDREEAGRGPGPGRPDRARDRAGHKLTNRTRQPILLGHRHSCQCLFFWWHRRPACVS